MKQPLSLVEIDYPAAKARPQASAGVRVVLLCLAIALASGCQSQKSIVIHEQAPEKTAVVLQPGDVVQIVFPTSPELNQTQKIREDGKINLAMVGEVEASGRSPGALQDDLEARYKVDLNNDEVVVTLVSSETSIYISGAVNKPGEIEFDRPITVLTAVEKAGGFTYVANSGSVRLIRQSGGQTQTRFLDMRGAFNGKPITPVYLKPGDIVSVPEKAFNF